jgi:hypothetical protein
MHLAIKKLTHHDTDSGQDSIYHLVSTCFPSLIEGLTVICISPEFAQTSYKRIFKTSGPSPLLSVYLHG